MAQFWNELRSTAFVTKHPRLKANDFEHTAPIGFHGDAGGFSHQDSFMVMSWNGLLARGRTRTKRFVFTAIRKAEYTPQTLEAIFKILAWSVNTMMEGVWPSVNHNNVRTRHDCTAPLAERQSSSSSSSSSLFWRACLCQIRGGWQFFVEIFQFPPGTGQNECVGNVWRPRATDG